MSVADATTFYAPEQDVLTYGIAEIQGSIIGGDSGVKWNGSTKTMRKLMGGDSINLVVNGATANIKPFAGIVQFFCKT